MSVLEKWAKVETRLAALASLIGLPVSLLGLALTPPTAREVVFSVGLVFVFVGGGISFLMTARRSGRRARYAEAIVNVHEAVQNILIATLADSWTLEPRKVAISHAMDDLAKAFIILTGGNCRCCLKVLQMNDNVLGVVTFCRQSKSVEVESFHPIQHNTDFHGLLNDKKRKWFFGQDLPAKAGSGAYNNSTEHWQSRYRATIVWPIRQSAGLTEGSPELLGFLCVDSLNRTPFSEEDDYPVGAMVADALGAFLIRLASLGATSQPKQEVAAPTPSKVGPGPRKRKGT